MAHRSLATRIWARAAAYALRRHPGPGAPPPPAAAAVAAGSRSVNVSTIRNQVNYSGRLPSHPPCVHSFIAGPAAAAAAGSRSVNVSTIRNQAKPQSNIKRNQQEGVSALEKVLLSIEMEQLGNVAKQRMVELEAVRRQKKKALKVYGFTLAVLACMTVYELKMSP